MDILNQKIGSVGDIHVSIVDGKLVVGVDGDIDLAAQLEKLRGAHQADLIGSLLSAAEAGLTKLTAAPSA